MEILVGCIAYLHLTESNALARFLVDIPSPLVRARVSEVVSVLYEDVQELAKAFPFLQSESFAGDAIEQDKIDRLQLALTPNTWQQALLKSYLMLGLLDDFGIELVESLSGHQKSVLNGVLRDRRETGMVQEVLRDQIADDPRLKGSLALWGRRIVGDTLLMARSLLQLEGSTVHALQNPSQERSQEDIELIGHIEAAFANMIAEHTRRMDSLSLTA